MKPPPWKYTTTGCAAPEPFGRYTRMGNSVRVRQNRCLVPGRCTRMRTAHHEPGDRQSDQAPAPFARALDLLGCRVQRIAAFEVTDDLPHRTNPERRPRRRTLPIVLHPDPPAGVGQCLTATMPHASAGRIGGVNDLPPAAGVARRAADPASTVRANRRWWDGDADAYHAEHGTFLGDADFVWCPESLREEDAHLLGDVGGKRVLEIGCGAAMCARWLVAQNVDVVASDLSAGMLRHARDADARTGASVPLVQADAQFLPFAAQSFDIVFTAFGAVPFVADSRG